MRLIVMHATAALCQDQLCKPGHVKVSQALTAKSLCKSVQQRLQAQACLVRSAHATRSRLPEGALLDAGAAAGHIKTHHLHCKACRLRVFMGPVQGRAQVAARHLMASPSLVLQGQPLLAALTYPPAPPLDLGHCSLEAVPAAEEFERSWLNILDLNMTV